MLIQNDHRYILSILKKNANDSQGVKLCEKLNRDAAVLDYSHSLLYLQISVSDLSRFLADLDTWDKEFEEAVTNFTYYMGAFYSCAVSHYEKSIHITEILLFGYAYDFFDKNGLRKEWMSSDKYKSISDIIKKMSNHLHRNKFIHDDVVKIKDKRDYISHAGSCIPSEIAIVCLLDIDISKKILFLRGYAQSACDRRVSFLNEFDILSNQLLKNIAQMS